MNCLKKETRNYGFMTIILNVILCLHLAYAKVDFIAPVLPFVDEITVQFSRSILAKLFFSSKWETEF